MENVFEELLNASTAEEDVTQTSEETESTAEETEENGEFDLDLGSLLEGNEESESSETDEDDETDDEEQEDDELEAEDTPTNNAFAQMRIQNKELSGKLNELDAIAKAAGLKDVDELIAKTKEAQIKRQAKEQGIPESVAKELEEMRQFREETRQKEVQAVEQAKEQAFVGNLQTFISDNSLSKEAVQKLSDNLEKDGFEVNYLMNLPKKALTRILSSYVGVSTQKNLERKDAIKNELPLSQSSKIDTKALNKEIDALAREFAGK